MHIFQRLVLLVSFFRWHFWVVKSVVLAFFFWSPSVVAQAFDAHEPNWEGISELVTIANHMVGEDRIVSTNVLNWSALSPGDAVLIVHPQVAMVHDSSAAFMKAGGRIAVIDDYGVGDRMLASYRLRRVSAPTDPLFTLRGNPFLILAQPAEEWVEGQTRRVHPVVNQLGRVVTNHPTGWYHADLSPVLIMRGKNGQDVSLAVAGQVGKGRLFALADGSVFINNMLRYPGNRALAEALLLYLVEDDTWGHRQGKIVLLWNHFQEEGTFASASSSSAEAWNTLRSAWRNLQENGQKSVASLRPWTSLALAMLGTLGSIAWAGTFCRQRFFHRFPNFAQPTALVAQGGIRGRAAVLAASTTPRGLLFLEQRHAIEAQIALLFHLQANHREADVWKQVCEGRTLPPDLTLRLQRILRETSRVEKAMISGGSMQVRRSTLLRAEKLYEEVLNYLRKASFAVPSESKGDSRS